MDFGFLLGKGIIATSAGFRLTARETGSKHGSGKVWGPVKSFTYFFQLLISCWFGLLIWEFEFLILL